MVKRFLEKEIKPFYNQWEKDGIIPRDVWYSMGANGLLAVDLPEEYGGSGVSYLYSMVVLEEASYANYGSLATGLSVHSDIAAPYVLHIGNEAQRQQWLPKMASGEVIGAIGMTEPGAGSDLQAIRTTAILNGDHYVLNGSKTFITNGQHADLVILAAKTDPNAWRKRCQLIFSRYEFSRLRTWS
jgi:alkylation response protein AidB-like acyl-CoA dehydrogenase